MRTEKKSSYISLYLSSSSYIMSAAHKHIHTNKLTLLIYVFLFICLRYCNKWQIHICNIVRSNNSDSNLHANMYKWCQHLTSVQIKYRLKKYVFKIKVVGNQIILPMLRNFNVKVIHIFVCWMHSRKDIHFK